MADDDGLPRRPAGAPGLDRLRKRPGLADIDEAPAFLGNVLGATYACGNYALAGCPGGETENDLSYCVRQAPVGGGAYAIAADLDLYGSGCPADYEFDVLGATGTGAGTRSTRRS